MWDKICPTDEYWYLSANFPFFSENLIVRNFFHGNSKHEYKFMQKNAHCKIIYDRKWSNIWELNILQDSYRIEYHAVIDNHICGAPVMIWESAYDEIKFATDIVHTGRCQFC